MPDQRKPPVSNHRPEPAPHAEDTFEFSIETTTMRLKSLAVRRAEAADKQLDEQLRADSRTPVKATPPQDSGSAGRVRHDDRGMAVWDWAVASGEFAALSATNVMRKLEVSDLQVEQTQRAMKAIESPLRDQGGGGDPYNQRQSAITDGYNPYNPYGNAPPAALPGGDPYNTKTAAPNSAGTIKRPPPASLPAGKKTGRSVFDKLLGKKK